MSNIYQRMMRLTAIAIGSLLASIYSLPLNAQSTILEDIETDENLNWTFTSEKEPISVKDDIRELKTYSISDEENGTDLQLTEENPKWGNRGDVDDYSLEVEVYDY